MSGERTAVRITADQQVCVAAGMCALTAPEVFDQEEHQGTVVLLAPEPTGDQEALVREAIALCPSGALRLGTG
ncbi:Ferredoxin-1 [Streptomyces sp. enrichment culture]|uniref:ferredoxin n=1 Tax=Streptomyces xiamenensis TaxID=408015 RepID=UPI0037D55632